MGRHPVIRTRIIAPYCRTESCIAMYEKLSGYRGISFRLGSKIPCRIQTFRDGPSDHNFPFPRTPILYDSILYVHFSSESRTTPTVETILNSVRLCT